MKDSSKTKAQLIAELEALRRRVVELEAAEVERKQTEKALRRSEARFRSYFELPLTGIAVTLPDKGWLQVNDRLCEMLGYSRKELMRLTWAELTHPDDLAADEVQYARVLAGEIEGYSIDKRFIRKDGTVIYTSLSSRCVRGPDGSVEYTLTVIQDITERKRMEEAEREQRVLAEALRDTAATLNNTLHFDQVLDRILANVGRVVAHDAASIMLLDAEQGVARIYRSHGYAERGMNIDMHSWRFKMADFASLRTMAETGQPMIVPDTYADPDWIRLAELDWQRSYIGAPIRVRGQIFGFMNLDSATPGFFTPVHGVHLQAFADQAAIAIENARLYDQAHRHAHELEQQATELQRRNEDLDAFAHTVAHDLKNPAGLILGYAETLAQDYVAMSDDQRQRSLQVIARNGRKIKNIIEELLLLAEVRQVQVEMGPLDMMGIVREAHQRLADLFGQSHAEIVWPDASAWPMALGYAPWVEEVWVNYLSNALKYGGKPPRVELGVETQSDGMVRFWVRDNGPGIPSEAQASLFTPFTRLDQVRAQGYGLGLSIVRRIVEKLDGKVGVESEGVPGHGSLFYFALPGAS